MDARPRFEAFLTEHPGCAFVQPFLSAFPDAGLFLVGGAVRDVLLLRPCVDVDFVVTGLSGDVIEAWLAAKGEVMLVGRDFGVYKFLPEGLPASADTFVDIALPRTEQPTPDAKGGYRDFKVKTDKDLSIEMDLARRDFTVNAMAYDVRSGNILDPHGGEEDLQARSIRAVGTPGERFSEDLSRVLRGIRFSVQLGFEIEEATWKAICTHASAINRKKEVEGTDVYVVPRETVGREIAKTLTANPGPGAERLRDAGLLAPLFPALPEPLPADYLTPLQNEKPGLTASLALLLRALPFREVVAALHGAGLDSLPTDSPLRVHVEDAAWIVGQLCHPPAPATSLPASTFERMYLNDRGRAYLEALLALGHGNAVRAAAEREAAIRARFPGKTNDRMTPLVTGTDILALGIGQGPLVRQWLDRVRNEQLDGRLASHEEAVRWLKRHLVSHET